MTEEERARAAKTTRRDQYLGHLSATEQSEVARFMGKGAAGAMDRLVALTPSTKVSFKQRSLLAFQKYASLLAGTDEDKPDGVWTKRKRLLDRAVSYSLGKPEKHVSGWAPLDVPHPNSPTGRNFDWSSLGVPHPRSPAGRNFDYRSSLGMPHPNSPTARLGRPHNLIMPTLAARSAANPTVIPSPMQGLGSPGFAGSLMPSTDTQNLPVGYTAPPPAPAPIKAPQIRPRRNRYSSGYDPLHPYESDDEMPDVPESEKANSKEDSDRLGEENSTTPSFPEEPVGE